MNTKHKKFLLKSKGKEKQEKKERNKRKKHKTTLPKKEKYKKYRLQFKMEIKTEHGLNKNKKKTTI